MLIDVNNDDLSLRRQRELLGVARSSYYHQSQSDEETEENLAYLRLIDEQYLRTPFFGSRPVNVKVVVCAAAMRLWLARS